MSKLPLPPIPPSLRGSLSQPASIAMAASVGIHGLLFVLLPMLPSNSFEAQDNEQRTVDLVELTPEELSRLPDLSGPTTPSFPQLPKIEAQDPSQSDLFSLPNLSTRTPIIPNRSSQPFFIPPYPPSITIQPPIARSTTPPAQPSPQEPTASPTSPAPQQTPAPVLGETRSLPELENFDVTALPGSLTERPQAEDQNSEQPSDTLMAEQTRMRELFTYNKEGTTSEDGITAFGDWFYRELGQEGKFPDENRLSIDADYNLTACQVLGRIREEPKSVTATYGIVVDANGAVKAEPRLIVSSGFEYFNQKALEAIANYEFTNETESDRILLVDVEFEYSEEKCPAPAVPAEDAPTG